MKKYLLSIALFTFTAFNIGLAMNNEKKEISHEKKSMKALAYGLSGDIGEAHITIYPPSEGEPFSEEMTTVPMCAFYVKDSELFCFPVSGTEDIIKIVYMAYQQKFIEDIIDFRGLCENYIVDPSEEQKEVLIKLLETLQKNLENLNDELLNDIVKKAIVDINKKTKDFCAKICFIIRKPQFKEHFEQIPELKQYKDYYVLVMKITKYGSNMLILSDDLSQALFRIASTDGKLYFRFEKFKDL